MYDISLPDTDISYYRVCQKHRPLVFLAGLLLVKEYATYVKFHTGSEI
jgi:hypothetical protein